MGNFYAGTITKVAQGVQVKISNNGNKQIILLGNFPASVIQPALSLRASVDGPVPVVSFADLLRDQQKANYGLKMKTELAHEMLKRLDEISVDIGDEEWERVARAQPNEGDRVFQATKNRFLDKLIVASAAVDGKYTESEDESHHSDSRQMRQLLKARYKKNDHAFVTKRASELVNTPVLVPDEAGYLYRKGTVTAFLDGGQVEVEVESEVPSTRVLLQSLNQAYLDTHEHDLQEEMKKAIYRTDEALRNFEIFVHNGAWWNRSTIKKVYAPCFIFEMGFDTGWTKWCTLDQLRDFSLDTAFARNAFWKTVGKSTAKPPAEDKRLVGKRMLIQNRSQNLGGRIVQSHTAGTIASVDASDLLYVYEKGTDLAEGKYHVSRQYQAIMELTQQRNRVGTHQLYYFPDNPPTISPNDRVLSEWRTGYWYIGTVTHATPGGWHVSYDDGDQQDDLTPARLIHLETARYHPLEDEAMCE